MIEVLVHRHLDRERRRVPRTWLELQGPRGGVDAAVAGTAILLALMLQDREPALDDRDFFAVLGLARHLDERPAALRADQIGLVELVDEVEDRERRLHPRAMSVPGSRLGRRALGSGPRPLLGLLGEDRPLALGEQLLEGLHLALHRGGVLALEAGVLFLQLPDVRVQRAHMAIEQHRHLPQRVDVLDPLDIHRARSRSWCDLGVKNFWGFSTEKGSRAERHATHERAALEEQLQLVERQLQRRFVTVAPQAGEAPLLQTLGVDAQPGAVPEKNLGPLPGARHEDEQIPREGIPAEPLGHQSAQPVEPLAQIDGPAEGVDGDLPGAADHTRARSNATRPAAPRPSTRNPWGVISTGRSRSATGAVAIATRPSRGRAGGCSHSRTARGRTPSSRATAATATPTSPRFRAIATALRRRAGVDRNGGSVRGPK